MKTAITIVNHSFFRFLLVGILNTLVGYSSIFFLLNILELNYWAATFTGNSIGAVVSYFLNRRFTFRSQAGIRESFWRFVSVILVCYAVSYALSYLAGHFLSLVLRLQTNIAENLAVLIGTGFYTIFNYFGHRFFTFKKRGLFNE